MALAEIGNRSEPAKLNTTTSASSHQIRVHRSPAARWVSLIRIVVGETTLALAVPAA